MKTLFKILGGAVLLVLVLAGSVLAWLAFRSPDMRPPSTETIAATPERLARGRYLAHHVSGCMACHSSIDCSRYACPRIPGTEGQGGHVFDAALNVPGVVCAQNLTPDRETGKGTWTDGELMRAIREGVSRDGRALFPMMPYPRLRHLSDDDVRSIVAYLRTLAPIRHEIPEPQLDFPVNLLIKFVPKPVPAPIETPDDEKDHHAYGKYLVTIGGCQDCHTPRDSKQKPVAGLEFSGGWTLRGPWGVVVTANITPHPSTYVGQANKDAFIGRFKAFAGRTRETSSAALPGRNTVMPWLDYAGMTEKDLGAIYDYLKTVKPIDKPVNPFPHGT
jgi:mono/diheme cytochrome c family protein